jgi:BirA family biotin operon repressor/biotin-[acetyl-CoA-carboxylase] ligase
MSKTYILEECASTNLEARDAKYTHGDAIIAIRQTEGRGQRGTKWDSRAGENLTFSLVLEPAFLPAAQQFLLSEAAALSVADTLAVYGIDARIKWPNDIYVGDRKICGILIEHDLRDDRLSRTIAGIGINVNQTVFPEWVPNPTSMLLETGNTFDIHDVFATFRDMFEARYSSLAEGEQAQIEADYRSLLYRLDQLRRYSIPGRGEVEGAIRDVEPSGRLIVEIDGEMHGFLFKEIEYIL